MTSYASTNVGQYPKAIETEYGGIRFRSRLEARWAVFFDTLGICWEYEAEAYALPVGAYLPDFYLPDLDAWFEVKGAKEEGNGDKLHALVEATGKNGYLATGSMPTEFDCSGPIDNDYPDYRLEIYYGDGGWDAPHAWCVCKCGKVGIEYEARSERVCGLKCYPMADQHAGNNGNHSRILNAYMAARAYRFWNPS